MENIVCKSCGGSVTRQGNYYVCDFCRSKWMIDSGNDVHAVERANAWAALREGDFEKAAELFESIIVKDGNSHEGYWGRALALNGIIYVDDVREGKKVPTCNNITENPFLKDKDVQKAIALAPEEIKKSYQAQAEQIEKIRVEWLNVASKEPPYDVFISFKDSDRERGIERTQDSIDAQDIYTGLVDAGYKVFYSRVSLRGKVSEQYEPYIYNAIKTAKVMIVFGEKPEYFSSTWIKNEWSRFRARIEKGEKHKNSLVVVVKNMNPSDLPVALKSRQAMNMSDLTFFETLKKHIKRVIEESNKGVRLDKIEIKGGQIAKKATTLEVNTVQTREIGAGATAQTDITELQTLSLADTYMKAKQWEEAAKLVDDVLFNNPSCAEALWKQILIGKRVVDNIGFSNKMYEITETDLQYVDKILNCANQEMASEILDLLYDGKKSATDATYCQILKTILPYQYGGRAKNIVLALSWAIQNSKKRTFFFLLTTLGNKDVDRYIKYNLQYAKTTKSNAEKKECADRILQVDEGNMEALKILLYAQLQDDESAEKVIKPFESILKYSHDNRAEISELLTWLGKNLNSLDDCALVKQVLRYSTDDISTWKTELITLAETMIFLGYFEEAEYLLKLVLTFDALNPTVYWNICLIKIRAKAEEEIVYSDISLKDIPEYTKYLTLVDEKRRLECIDLQAKQVAKQAEIKHKKEEDEKKLVKKQEDIKKRKKTAITIGAIAVATIVAISCAVEIPKAMRGYCTMEKVSYYYEVTGIDSNIKGTITIPDTYKGLKVRQIEEYAFSRCTNLKSVTFGSNIAHIWNYAFRDCSNLKEVKLNDGLYNIDTGAFENCSNLTKIIIPESVGSISYDVFDGCNKLTIYCEAESAPEGWDSEWNCYRPVVWGYKEK